MPEISKEEARPSPNAEGSHVEVDSQGGTRSRGAVSRAAIARAVAFLVAIAAWQVLAEFNVLDQDNVSKPNSIVAAITQLAQDPEAVRATQETLVTVGSAFVIGTSLGLLAGIVIGLQSLMRNAYLPVITIMLGTPKSVPVYGCST